MSSYYPISGYGIVNLESIIDENKILDEEGTPDYFLIEDSIAAVAYGEDIGYVFGLPLQLPYGENVFKTEEELKEYLFNAVKEYLKEDIAKENLVIDEYCDYEIS